MTRKSPSRLTLPVTDRYVRAANTGGGGRGWKKVVLYYAEEAAFGLPWLRSCTPPHLVDERQLRAGFAGVGRERRVGIVLVGETLNQSQRRLARIAALFGEAAGGEVITIRRAKLLPGLRLNRNIARLLMAIRKIDVDLLPDRPRAGDDCGMAEIFTRRYPLKAYQELFAVLQELGIRPHLNLLLGVPGESEDGVLRYLREALSLQPSRLVIHRLCAPPGSWLREAFVALGLQIAKKHPFVILGTAAADSEEARRVFLLAYSAARKYNYWRSSADEALHEQTGQLLPSGRFPKVEK